MITPLLSRRLRVQKNETSHEFNPNVHQYEYSYIFSDLQLRRLLDLLDKYVEKRDEQSGSEVRSTTAEALVICNTSFSLDGNVT